MKHLVLAALMALTPAAAMAHEPLWGESPQTFAFGVFHPEFRLGYENDSLLFGGSRRLLNPAGLRMTRLDALMSVQYAPSTSLNVKLEAPWVQVRSSQLIGGAMRTSNAAGLGDIVLSAKNRFAQQFGPDWKLHQAVTAGIQLPTGRSGGQQPDGTRLSASERPGTGNLGYVLGYSAAYERLQDTVWASVMLSQDVTGGDRRGAMLMVDAAYGYWLRRAYRPQDLGVLGAVGVHYEWMSPDRLAGAADPNSGYDRFGVHASLIATKGQLQARAGVLVPVYQRYRGQQLGFDVQVRAGIEALL